MATLREYLIKLGFDVDEEEWKKFQGKVGQSAKNVAELGAVSVGTALAIGVAVERVAKHYEDLYYVSQRSGSSISMLKAQEFGFTQVGLTADQARSAVEGFAASVRTNPGIRAMFQGMGIDTSDATKAIGQLVDKTKARFGEQGYFVAERIAAMGGVDEGTFRQIWANREDEKRYEEEHIARQQRIGVNTEKLGDASRDYSRKLRDVRDEYSVLGDRVAQDFLPIASKVLDWVEGTTVAFTKVNNATGGWAADLGAVAIAAGGVKAALIPVVALLRSLGIIGPAGASLGLGRMLLGGALRFLGPVGAFAAVMAPVPANANEGPLQGGPAPGDNSPAAQAWRAKNGGSKAAMMEFYKSKGWTPAQAAGIVANLDAESGLKPNLPGDGGAAYGLGQWHKDRQANFARWAGHDIRDSTLQEQMEFVHYELTQGTERLAGNALRNQSTARGAGSTMSRMYERPKAVLEAAQNRGAASEAILASDGGGGSSTTQTNHITVSGVSDPKKAADLVVEGQKRVNGDITRNTASNYY